jgi:hypothetical protein
LPGNKCSASSISRIVTTSTEIWVNARSGAERWMKASAMTSPMPLDEDQRQIARRSTVTTAMVAATSAEPGNHGDGEAGPSGAYQRKCRSAAGLRPTPAQPQTASGDSVAATRCGSRPTGDGAPLAAVMVRSNKRLASGDGSRVTSAATDR